MSGSSDDAIVEFEHQLEGAERALSELTVLSDRDAERVAARMDRLASQLLEISSPPPIADVHRRLGTVPAGSGDFASLAERMGSADREG